MKAVLLLAHGTPETLDQMPEYLKRVRGGRPPSPPLVAEMTRNYAAIGGRSPLTDITRAQAAAIAEALGGARVYVGMRNWAPEVEDAVRAAERDGAAELVAVPMTPQYGSTSLAKYREAVETARPAVPVEFLSSWHDDPGIVRAFAGRLQAAAEAFPPDQVVFSAHSLPLRVIRAGDPYSDQVAATAAAVAKAVSLADYRLAWQSAGRTPEPWLGPSLEETLAGLGAAGARRVLVAPVGFVCDHTEILFDVDVQAMAFARERGIELRRTESLNTSPAFVAALAALVRPHLA